MRLSYPWWQCSPEWSLPVSQFTQIDDVVDAVPVHGACGIWGVLALGLFGDPDHGMGGNGLIYAAVAILAQAILAQAILAQAILA